MSSIVNHIKPLPGFQYSVNLKYDYDNYEKIENYILTSGTISVLKDIFSSFKIDSIERSNLLIGPYGKGKSHFVLVLLSFMWEK